MLSEDDYGMTDDDDLTEGHSKSGMCRGIPARRARRRPKVPPGPVATLETPHQQISFVKRGGGHDTAAGGHLPPAPSPLYTPAAGPSFTSYYVRSQ